MADYLRIIPASSNSSGFQPAPNEIQTGELALNTADAVLYTKTPEGTVVPIVGGAGASGSAGGDYGYYAGAPVPQPVAGLSARVVGKEWRLAWAPPETLQGSCDQATPDNELWVEAADCGSYEWNIVARVPITANDLSVGSVDDPAKTYRVVHVTQTGVRSESMSVRAGCGGTVQEPNDPPPPVNPPPPPYLPPAVTPPATPQVPVVTPVVTPVVPPTYPAVRSTTSGLLNWTTGWQCIADVVGGDVIVITATGLVDYRPGADANGGPSASPDGIPDAVYNERQGTIQASIDAGCSPNPTLRYMSVIGTISAGSTPTAAESASNSFFVGSSYSGLIPTNKNGKLCVRINDSCFRVRGGAFAVSMNLFTNPAP